MIGSCFAGIPGVGTTRIADPGSETDNSTAYNSRETDRMKNEAKEFDIQEYLTRGVERVVSEALRATLKDPKESAFMLRFAAATKAAAEKPNILFPIFTNGTYMDEAYFALFDKSRNLLPVMSIEGEKEITDKRRGEGIYDRLIGNMDELHRRGLIFGASVTVTKENIREVSSDSFLQKLAERGCKAVIFVEFVPVTEDSKELAPGDEEREYLRGEIARLRRERPEMVYISFPGDEKSSGGCVAAGRGFFHINSHGGAEPCPFSPYSDVNVRNTSLREALRSPLFTALRDGGILMEDHAGGCVLYEKRELVEALLTKFNQ